MAHTSASTASHTDTPHEPPLPRRRLLLFSGIFALFMLSANGLVAGTWTYLHGAFPWCGSGLLTLLSLSFLPLMLSGWRIDHPLLQLATRITAASLGLLNFLFFAALACWLALGLSALFGLGWRHALIAELGYALGALIALYGVLNAAWMRVSRVHIDLPGLPDAWIGRTAALVTDIHLGNIRRNRFLRRLVQRLNALRPDLILLSGDLFDGTRLDPMEPLQSWTQVQAPLGTYFVTGNHDEHFTRPKLFEALRQLGVRILENETLLVDGVKLIGIHDEEASDKELLKDLLARAHLERGTPSILLTHQPLNLPLVEAAGVSLQVSGHTHAGQFWPWNLVVTRVWGVFGYGLNRLGSLQVLTSSGVGTWGPPLRVGTRSEIVLITFGRSQA